MKGVSESQSKHNKFEEHKDCIYGEKYQKECDKDFIRSLNHKMYLHRVKKSTLSPFDDKRCYEINIENKPWE